jgi:hypothetical protein
MNNKSLHDQDLNSRGVNATDGHNTEAGEKKSDPLHQDDPSKYTSGTKLLAIGIGLCLAVVCSNLVSHLPFMIVTRIRQTLSVYHHPSVLTLDTGPLYTRCCYSQNHDRVQFARRHRLVWDGVPFGVLQLSVDLR